MTIYYNPAYSATPYRKNTGNAEFGNIYCGDVQLLQRLLFYAGIPYKDNISLDKDDDTFKYIKFPTDDDALRYVATEPCHT